MVVLDEVVVFARWFGVVDAVGVVDVGLLRAIAVAAANAEFGVVDIAGC